MINKFCVVRTHSAGVWAGVVKERNGQEVVLADAIRLWRWKGANTLSEMAMVGVGKPEECKFAMPVEEVLVIQAVEIIPATATAEASIRGVNVEPWWE